MYRKWVNGSFQNYFTSLAVKIIVAYIIICFVFHFFTEVPDLRSPVITLKVLWFNLILDFDFNFSLLVNYSCVGKHNYQIAVNFFSSQPREDTSFSCTLVQSENCFNLQYSIENSRKSSMT